MFLYKVICVVIAALCCTNAHVIGPLAPAPHFDVHPGLPFAAPEPYPHFDVHHPLPAPHFDVHPSLPAPHFDVHPAVPFAAPALPPPTIPFAAPAPLPVLPSPPLPTLALPSPVFTPALPVYDPLVFAPTYKAIPGPITKTHTVSLGYAYPHLGKYVLSPPPHTHAHSHAHLLKTAPLFRDHHHHLFA